MASLHHAGSDHLDYLAVVHWLANDIGLAGMAAVLRGDGVCVPDASTTSARRLSA